MYTHFIIKESIWAELRSSFGSTPASNFLGERNKASGFEASSTDHVRSSKPWWPELVTDIAVVRGLALGIVWNTWKVLNKSYLNTLLFHLVLRILTDLRLGLYTFPVLLLLLILLFIIIVIVIVIIIIIIIAIILFCSLNTLSHNCLWACLKVGPARKNWVNKKEKIKLLFCTRLKRVGYRSVIRKWASCRFEERKEHSFYQIYLLWMKKKARFLKMFSLLLDLLQSAVNIGALFLPVRILVDHGWGRLHAQVELYRRTKESVLGLVHCNWLA